LLKVLCDQSGAGCSLQSNRDRFPTLLALSLKLMLIRSGSKGFSQLDNLMLLSIKF